MKHILFFVSQALGFGDIIAGGINAIGNAAAGKLEKCIVKDSWTHWKNSVTCGIGERTRDYKYFNCELKSNLV